MPAPTISAEKSARIKETTRVVTAGDYFQRLGQLSAKRDVHKTRAVNYVAVIAMSMKIGASDARGVDLLLLVMAQLGVIIVVCVGLAPTEEVFGSSPFK